jgi:glucose/arabinose dehydrogenase
VLSAGVALVLLSIPAVAQVRSDVYVSGLSAPVAFVQDPSAPDIQMVVELEGRIRVVQDGVLLADPFLNISNVVVSGGERGLLGLVFAPDYIVSRRLYVNFTGPGGHTVIARFLRHVDDPLRADPDSRFALVFPGGHPFITQPFTNHNGGDLHFGPDGYLYVGLGDGGAGNDPMNFAQDTTSLLGKMLRIDVNVPDADPIGYRVPPDNPFNTGSDDVRALIWALGLRNPWRFTFDSRGSGSTGALIIADVGQSSWEEVNYEPAGRGGRNYGWRIREGAHPNPVYGDPTTDGLTDPVIAYTPQVGRSIIGGAVYRGLDLGPLFHGRYFFGDLTGRVWSARFLLDSAGEVVDAEVADYTDALGGPDTLGLVTAFGVDAACRLYVVNLNGTILRISSTDAPRAAGCGPPTRTLRPRCPFADTDVARIPREALRRLCERVDGG